MTLFKKIRQALTPAFIKKMFMTLTPDWYEWVHFNEAKFIVVGADHMGGYGVVATTLDKWTAYRIRRFVNESGGSVKVEEYGDETITKISDMVMEKAK